MCHERYLRRRQEADESREVWQDFERTQPVGDAPTPEAAAEPETAEEREAIGVSER